MAKTFFTSDLHLGHQGILEYTDRGAHLTMGGGTIDIEAHNKWVIDVLNGFVNPEDQLYILGDVVMGSNPWIAGYWISQIKCKHVHLMLGNHDESLEEFYHESGLFESVQTRLNLRVNKKLIILDHFPIAEWHAGHSSSWHLHGHSHSNFDYVRANLHDKRILDVGFDNSVKVLGHYGPFEFEDVQKYMEGKVSIEHHGKAD